MRPWFAVFFLVIGYVIHAQEAAPFSLFNSTPDALSNFVVEEGSSEDAQIFQELILWLRQEGLSWKETHLADPILGHSFSRQIRVETGADPQLVLFLPINGKGGAANARLGTELAAMLVEKGLPLGISLVFSGAEDPKDTPGSLGLNFFLRSAQGVETQALIYIDASGGGKDPRIQTIAAGGVSSPAWMVLGLLDAFGGRGLPIVLAESRPQFFRFNLPGHETPLDRAVSFGFQSVSLIWNARDGAALVQGLSAFFSTLGSRLPSAWDKHYLIFGNAPGAVPLSQLGYIGLILLVVALSLGVGFAFKDKVYLHLHSLLQGLWQVGLFFSLLLLILYTSTLGLQVLEHLLPGQNNWESSPFLFLLWKVSLAILLYLIFFLFVRKIPLYRWNVFYQASALFLYGLYTLLAMWLSFGFSFFFLWSYFFVLIYILVDWRPMRMVLFVVIPFWTLKGLWGSFISVPDEKFMEAALFSPLEGNLLIGLFLLPLLLLFHGFHYQRHQRTEGSDASHLDLGTLLVTLIFIGASITVSRLEAPPDRPVILRETRDSAQNSIRLNLDNVPMGRPLELEWEGMPSMVKGPTAQFIRDIPQEKQFLEWSADLERLLDRELWTLRLRLGEGARDLALKLESWNAPLVVLDSSFPFRVLPGGSSGEFLIGRNPPAQVEIAFTLLKGPAISLSGQVGTRPHPSPPGLKPQPHLVDSELVRVFREPLEERP